MADKFPHHKTADIPAEVQKLALRKANLLFLPRLIIHALNLSGGALETLFLRKESSAS
ncbi:hypothetical protein GGR17_003828 [Confluentimicrobium naphthalenivorans]|uniref:Uncharacterized protein n=1 Tax=Actibacterium naphthalenivorans TaxID=1614693 RepID=A0A840CKF0_9RHOB|nr:hypothetical protein [Actibacterium naphthalenivorans]